ncbi:hypothetical protein BSKO_03959 [Bryopsis sp. KO-2023]|nr:hypothetical protein BSKO_03959 [Bryopsis sp. KO-2023]
MDSRLISRQAFCCSSPCSNFRGTINRVGFRPRSLSARKHCETRGKVLVRSGVTDGDVDLEDAAEAFMKEQAALEAGSDMVKLEKVVGSDVVPDEKAKEYCRDVVAVIEKLVSLREMTFNEIKLTVSIDDPLARDRRSVGIEDDSGASREEIAAALVEVNEGRIPKDRIALKVLREELVNWPSLEVKPKQAAEKPSNGYNQEAGWRGDQARPPIGRDKDEKPQSLEDMLPEWMGYSFLYIVSAIPLFIGLFVVFTLFVNSLQ